MVIDNVGYQHEISPTVVLKPARLWRNTLTVLPIRLRSLRLFLAPREPYNLDCNRDMIRHTKSL